MKNKIFKLSLLQFILIFLPVLVLAQQPSGMETLNWATKTGVSNIVGNIVVWIQNIALVIGVIMIIISGILWLTAGGNSEKVASARRTLIGGIIGITVALFAGVVVGAVGNFGGFF